MKTNAKDLAFLHVSEKAVDRMLWVAYVLMAIGILSLPVAFMLDHERLWFILAASAFLFLGLAHGGVLFAAAIRVVYAKWGRHVVRPAEALGALIPVGYLLWLLIFLKVRTFYYWAGGHAHHHHPGVWLNLPFFTLRNLGIVTLISLLALYLLYLSLKADAGVLPEMRRGWFRRFGDLSEEELVRIRKRLVNLGVVYALVFAWGWSTVGFDMVMGMDPIFYSNMFGGYFFWSLFLAGVAATLLVVLLLRKGRLGEVFHEATLHDLGKAVFAFSTFWAYLFWSQLLVIWYGRLPEETEYLFTRFVEPWKPYLWSAFAASWFVPFVVLIPKKTKVTPWIVGPVTLLLLGGIYLARLLEIVPTVWTTVHGKPGAPVGVWEFGAFLGLAGLFLLIYALFLRNVPVVPVSDPRLEDALHPEHH